MERAVNKIPSIHIMVEEDDDDDEEYVQLLDNTGPSSVRFYRLSTDASSPRKQVVDLIEKLGPKQTVDNWDDLNPWCEFCLAVANLNSKRHWVLRNSIEDALFAKLTEAKIGKPIEQNMAAAIQFFAHATDNPRCRIR